MRDGDGSHFISGCENAQDAHPTFKKKEGSCPRRGGSDSDLLPRTKSLRIAPVPFSKKYGKDPFKFIQTVCRKITGPVVRMKLTAYFEPLVPT